MSKRDKRKRKATTKQATQQATQQADRSIPVPVSHPTGIPVGIAARLKALGSLGEEILAGLADLEALRKTRTRAGSSGHHRVPLAQTLACTYHLVLETCEVCGETRRLVGKSTDNGMTLEVLPESRPEWHELTGAPRTLSKRYCAECQLELDEIPRANLVWLVENLLPLVPRDHTARMVEVMQKGLGLDTSERRESARRRREEKNKHWEDERDCYRAVPANGLKTEAASRPSAW